MRTLRLLALSAVLTPAMLAPVACEDASSSSGGLGAFEAGPGFEAGTVAEAGPLADTSVSPKGVTVTVRTGAAPQVGVRVLGHDAAGAITSDALTDATGTVSLATAPSMVTVLATQYASPAAVSFVAVADGDTLLVVSPADPSPPAGAYSVSLTPGGLITDVNAFILHTGNANANCDTGGGAPNGVIQFAVTAGCVAAKNALLVTAANAGGTVAFAFAKDLVGPAGTATLPVGPLAFTAPGTTTVTASNVPDAGRPGVDLYAIASGQTARLASTGGALDGAGATFASPTGYADAYQTVVATTLFGVGGSSYTQLVRREATTAPAAATLANLDFSAALPAIDLPTLTRTTPERPEVTLAPSPALAGADAALIRLNYYSATTATNCWWTFVVPASTTAFKVPELPVDATLAPFVPRDPNVYVNDVVYFDASQLPDYQAAKKIPVAPHLGADLTDTARPLPAAGTLRVVHLSNG
jgi:hypothetical protein